MQDELIVANFDNGSGELRAVIEFDLQAGGLSRAEALNGCLDPGGMGAPRVILRLPRLGLGRT